MPIEYRPDEGFLKRELKAGELLFAEGDPGDFAYIIEKGEIEIWTNHNGKHLVLNVLGPGSLFGELALIDGRSRSASATVKSDARLTLLSQEQVDRRIQAADPILRMLLLVVIRYFRSETIKWRPTKIQQLELPYLDDYRADLSGRIEEAVERIRMENDLRTAIEEKQFLLHYQPIIHFETRRIVGFEALIRWQSPTRGYLRPDQFVPLAESTSLIVPIGEWVIEEGAKALQKMERETGKQIFLSLNIASRQIEELDFVDSLIEHTKRIGVEPCQIKLEILERCLFDSQTAIDWVERCRSIGFPLVLDDFGTGYSSLEYLNKYNFDTLKIDKSFVWNLNGKAQGRSICRAIVDLSKALGMTVVAEGVETPEQVEALQDMGCAFGQGYLFAKPVSLEEAIALLANPQLRIVS